MSGELWLFITITFVTCITPGAGVLYTITNAFRYGKRRAFLSPLGNMTGCAVMSAVSAAGLGAVITASPVLFTGLQAAGALVLIWMGWKNWKAAPVDFGNLSSVCATSDGQKTGLKTALGILGSAALLQLTNPMLIVFLLSLLPPFIHPENDYAMRMTLLVGIFLATVLAVHLVYSYTAALIAEHLKGKRFSLILNKMSAVFFWLLAAGVLWKILVQS